MPDQNQRPTPVDYLMAWPQYLLPQHALSRLVLKATRWETPWWKDLLIAGFRRRFAVDMSTAQQPDPHAYASFNAFFTRAMKADARPIATAPEAIVSPVDGCVSQAGRIDNGRIFQAKGQDFSLHELLGGADDLAESFRDGQFATLYLSPRDYHRIHMPLTGRLATSVYIPGRLFSVAPHTISTVPRVFARNERLVTLFDTEAGPMAMILVGALFVACIETVWAGVVTPPHGSRIRRQDHHDPTTAVQLMRGAEMGRFNMGSTVILLYGEQRIRWADSLLARQPVRMGEAIGQVL